MIDNLCPDCRVLTSGDCGKHTGTVPLVVQYCSNCRLLLKDLAAAQQRVATLEIELRTANERVLDLSNRIATRADHEDQATFGRCKCRVCALESACKSKDDEVLFMESECKRLESELAEAQRERDVAKRGWVRTEDLYLDRVGKLIQETHILRSRLAGCMDALQHEGWCRVCAEDGCSSCPDCTRQAAIDTQEE